MLKTNKIFNSKMAMIMPYVFLGLLCIPVCSNKPVVIRRQIIQGLESQMIRSGAWLNIDKLPESQIMNLRDILAKFGNAPPDSRPNKFSKDTFG